MKLIYEKEVFSIELILKGTIVTGLRAKLARGHDQACRHTKPVGSFYTQTRAKEICPKATHGPCGE